MRRELFWLLSVKLAVLGLLWLLFFSSAHQPAIDPGVTGRHLGLEAAPSRTLPGGGGGSP
jgi:hypothetical protein